MTTVNSDPVQDYILENEDNLRIAAAVTEAWPEAKEKLVSGFLDRLRSRLEEKLKGWKFDRWRRCMIDSNASFYFSKPLWKEEYTVFLAFFSQGQDVQFGVGRDADQEHIKKRPYIAELLPAVKESRPTASNKAWCEAAVTMRSPAADWHDPKVLWQMHTDPKFLEDVAEQLLGVAEISEPIVDRFVDGLDRKK